MDVGSHLRQAREARGLSLTELSNRTKIRVALLRAIDDNDFERLPGGVFTLGLLKAYAREAGVDPNAVAQAYVAATRPHTTVDEPRPPVDERGAPMALDPSPASVKPGKEAYRAAAVLAAFVLAALVIAFSRGRNEMQPEGASSASQPDVPAATTGTVPDARPAAAEAATGRLRVELRANGLCWIEATADGARVVYRLLKPGERETIEAEADVLMRVGEPGALSVTINGAPARPLGARGQPVWVRITPENVPALTSTS
jgi:cytoskeletal protein RodZ